MIPDTRTHVTRILALTALVALALVAGACSDKEGDTYVNEIPPSGFVVASANLVREASSCEPGLYRYDVVAHVAELPPDVRVIQINLDSPCGGGGSIFGQAGRAFIDLTSCEPCGITASAVLSSGSAAPATVPVTPCAELGCGEE